MNTEDGDFSETSMDASVATYGPPLTFERTYDSSVAQAEAASSLPGPLGYGWTHNWDTNLSLGLPVADDAYGIAGSSAGSSGHTGDGGAATSSLLDGPSGVAVDSLGDVYVADAVNNRVEEIAATSHTQWGF